MHSVYVPATTDHAASQRIVLLPGAFDSPDGFLAAGFDTAVQQRGLPLDLQFVALELAHVADRAILERVWQQVLLPARAAGCRHLWIGGISLGGFLALALAARHRTAVDGLCLLAPYLGSRRVSNEVAAAGTASRWLQAQSHATREDDAAGEDEDRALWRFIAGGLGNLPTWLGLARQDRFLDRHRLLAAELPAAAVATVEGEHDWPSWRKLWDNFLDTWTCQPPPTPGTPRRC